MEGFFPSKIPPCWAAREPPAVALGLADAVTVAVTTEVMMSAMSAIAHTHAQQVEVNKSRVRTFR